MGLFRFKKQKLGKGFGDFLEKGEKGEKWEKGEKGEKEGKVGIGLIGQAGLVALLFLGGVVLFGRLFYLTLTRGAYFRDLAENNRIKEKRIEAPRGVIYDKEGRVLARNRPIYKKCQVSSVKCQVLSREEAFEREAKGEELEVELGREYPQGEITAHVVGYMGEVSEADLQMSNVPASSAGRRGGDKCPSLIGGSPWRRQMSNESQIPNSKCQKYSLGDWKGRSGVEEAFEDVLRGVPGKRLVEVDAQGREVRELGRLEPVSGNNAYLSIDLNLQEAAAEAMREGTTLIGNNPVRVVPLKGAVVISNPQTGEILALYSSPSFEANLFVKENKTHETYETNLEEILSDSSQPLFNRAISGLYPPGSTFKIVTAAAGLESGAIDEKTTVEDTGVITIGPYQFPNWYFRQYGRKEGEVDVVKAIQRSNDIFFYKVGEWLGIERLEEWAKRFGLEKKLGIEIAGEAAGIVRRSREWFLGDTYHLAIGQGDLLVTPLQVNSWTSVIANGGKLCQPRVLHKTDETHKTNCQDIGLKEKTISLIREGMRKACAPAEEAGEVGGTGWPLFKFKVKSQKLKVEREIPLGCKTGTAEYGEAEGATHAWLTAFAPAEDPEIVVTVLVEGGGEGSSVAGPIVKKLLEEWFRAKPK